jgi:hypothetical protein
MNLELRILQLQRKLEMLRNEIADLKVKVNDNSLYCQWLREAEQKLTSLL